MSYHIKDWNSVIAKCENCISNWSFRWLSNAGRLVLTKSIIEATSVFWLTLSWIPRGILESIRKLMVLFFWSENLEQKGYSWIKWKNIARPKILVGRWIKNLQNFQSFSRRLLKGTSLWNEVIIRKYIAPKFSLQWV